MTPKDICTGSPLGDHSPRMVLTTENSGLGLPRPPAGHVRAAAKCDHCGRIGYAMVPIRAVAWLKEGTP